MELSLAYIRSRAPALAWVLVMLMAVVPLCQHNWSEVVFCVETNGEINLESRHPSGHDSPVATRISRQQPYEYAAYFETATVDHNNVCIDVSLQIKSAQVHVGALTVDDVSVDIALPPALDGFLADDRIGGQVSETLVFESETEVQSSTSELTSLQTVVLLI